jgi:hypothetical protein
VLEQFHPIIRSPLVIAYERILLRGDCSGKDDFGRIFNRQRMRLREPLMNRSLEYTGHAWQRKNERCKTDILVDTLLCHFDRDIYLGRGLWAWSLSREWCRELQKLGMVSAALAERLPSLALIVAEDGAVITVVRGTTEFGRYCERH